MRLGMAFFVVLIMLPLAYSLPIKELVAKYSFSSVTQQMNVTSHTDYMIDKNSNGINDTLVLELATENTAGTFIFSISLFDENGILTNETNKTLGTGINNVNLTFNSILLSQNQFNYSIKIYNASRKQKYRKDGILTNIYPNYEEGYRVANISDMKMGRTLRVNVTFNSPVNSTHVTTLFLGFGNKTIFSKESKKIKSGTNYLLFDFNNETLKRTHFTGNFTIPSIKIGTKTIKIGALTKSYSFAEFAASSYIYKFSDNGIDSDGNGKFDFLVINSSLQIMKDGDYTLTAALYDLFENIIEFKSTSFYSAAGNHTLTLSFNGSIIHGKKLNGPYALKSTELYEGGILADMITDAHLTSNYNFNDFDNSGLPDITPIIHVSDAYRYGISNITADFTFSNIGSRHAFNVGTNMFDNKTFSIINKSVILNVNSSVSYSIRFTNISDIELTAIADLENDVDELNESNNAFKIEIKLNKKPNLTAVGNITANETGRITVNLSASDPNGDGLVYSINLSKFSNSSNIFHWNTTAEDSGDYILQAAASDGYLNDTSLFRITILNSMIKDTDNDGIEDDADEIIGLESSVNASGINLSILVNESRNLSKSFRHHFQVVFMDSSSPLLQFSYNFSRHKLRLDNLTLRKQSSNSTGSLLIRGINMQDGSTKTLFVDRINATNGICIKDEEINDIGEISNGCDSGNEFKVECDGTLQGDYMCTYNSSIKKYKIQGLKHSGIVQFDYRKPGPNPGSTSPASSTNSGSGGGGGGACISDWKCSEWSQCAGGIRNRKCLDSNLCAFAAEKPRETEQCAAEEPKLVDIAKPIGYARKITGGVKQGIKSGVFPITGQAVRPSQKPNIGVFIVFAEIVLIVVAYLLMKFKSSKMFK